MSDKEPEFNANSGSVMISSSCLTWVHGAGVVSGKPVFACHSIPSNKELTSPIKDLREQLSIFKKSERRF
jgi:hypothetical protein